MHTIGGNEYEPSAAEGEEHGEADFEGDEGPGIAGLGDSPHARKLQMNILRETCLREIVFTLVKVLKLTNRHAECVRLSDLVADSRYEIFKVSQEFRVRSRAPKWLFDQENKIDENGFRCYTYIHLYVIMLCIIIIIIM